MSAPQRPTQLKNKVFLDEIHLSRSCCVLRWGFTRPVVGELKEAAHTTAAIESGDGSSYNYNCLVDFDHYGRSLHPASSNEMMSCSSCTSTVSKLWAATQLKRHGQYPVRRVLALHEFANRSRSWKVAAVLAVTPLPCLIAMLAFEVVPLDPPSPEVGRNLKFYARELMIFYSFSACMLQQLSTQVGPKLSLSAIQIAGIALSIVTVNVGISYLTASVVGFPVPFTMQLSGTSYFILKALILRFVWRRQLSASPSLLKDIASGWLFMLGLYVLIIVYPVYYYAFMIIPDSAGPRIAFLGLLPILKCASRLLFARVLQRGNGGDELVPQQIVFIPNVVGSLFVAFCMQYSPSLLVSCCIMGVTVATKSLSFRDIRSAGREIAGIERQIYQQRQHRSPSCGPQHLSQGDETTKTNILDEVAEIIVRHNMHDREDTRMHPSDRMLSTRSASKTLTRRSQLTAFRSFWFPNCWLRVFQVAPIDITTVGPDDCIFPGNGPLDAVTQVHAAAAADSAEGCTNQHDKEKLEQLEQSYVTLVTKLLYMTEFTMLTEYVEAIIPLLYCKCSTRRSSQALSALIQLFVSLVSCSLALYVTVMFRLPNRVYFAQFADMDQERLSQTIENMLLYTGFEVFTLIGVQIVLLRLLRFSSWHQIGFVLTHQAAHVQSALIVSMTFSTQGSLDHFGECRITNNLLASWNALVLEGGFSARSLTFIVADLFCQAPTTRSGSRGCRPQMGQCLAKRKSSRIDESHVKQRFSTLILFVVSLVKWNMLSANIRR